MSTKTWTVVALSTLLTLAFQNCSEVKFDTEVNSENKLAEITDSILLKTEKEIDTVDLLIVLDESSSMRDIAKTLATELAKIPNARFPANTRIAVTNMAPAYYQDVAEQRLDFATSFIQTRDAAPDKRLTALQPGFVQLVSGQTIAQFLATTAPQFGRQFVQAGCAESWFPPGALNAEGVNCLIAHSQISLIGIGVESGVSTLKQLVIRHALDGQRLFREGSLANVIYISDTHDSGAGYYGQAGAERNLPTYESMRELILRLNPGLAGLKIHGIVPLPPSGHESLAGVQALGNLPQTLADSRITDEGLHDFSYLSFIAKSGGVAMHPIGNNWSEVFSEAVRTLKIQSAPVLTLTTPASKILSITADGRELSDGEYFLRPDLQTIELSSQISWKPEVRVEVRYVPLSGLRVNEPSI